MDSEKLDWAALDRLRQAFLSGAAARGPYWQSRNDLANYDATFGERIGWKWDAVLEELRRRGWRPNGGRVLDWGCGSGIAGRRVLRAFGPENFSSLALWDHSPLACEFAIDAAKLAFPSLEVRGHSPGDAVDLLVLSHVLNELSPEAREALLSLARKAHAVIWVEPGTHAVSRDLIGFREKLREAFRVVAPCTHGAVCGLLAPENARHWCHSFAEPPASLYADSHWVKFGQRAGIDLRSLPYSFLVLQKADAAASSGHSKTDASRIIGQPEHFKGFARWLNCDLSGVRELTLQKRDDPALFKTLKREVTVPVYHWTRIGDRITGGQPATAEPIAPNADADHTSSPLPPEQIEDARPANGTS